MKLKKRKKFLQKELSKAIENISEVQAAKMMGKHGPRIADGIIKSMNSCIKKTESKIEQVEIELSEIEGLGFGWKEYISFASFEENFLNTKPLKSNQGTKDLLESVIERIDVHYDKAQSEHELVIKTKIPLYGDSDLTALKLKKKKKQMFLSQPPHTPLRNNIVTVE